jgi:hypothetical protein
MIQNDINHFGSCCLSIYLVQFKLNTNGYENKNNFRAAHIEF